MHLRIQIPRRQIERNRAIVQQRNTIRHHHLLRLQIQQRIGHRRLARVRMLRLRLIRLPILIDDQMKLRMVNPQIVQPDMRLPLPLPPNTKEVQKLQPKLNLVRRQIRSLARPLQPMNHQPIGFDRQMPQVEA